MGREAETPESEVSALMSLSIVIKGPEGLVLAAESRVTLTEDLQPVLNGGIVHCATERPIEAVAAVARARRMRPYTSGCTSASFLRSGVAVGQLVVNRLLST